MKTLIPALRSSDLWKLRPSERAIVKKWFPGLLVYGVSLGLFALAAAMAISEHSQQPEPAAITGMANTYHGAGNLVPVF
jgi:hypothetical protein